MHDIMNILYIKFILYMLSYRTYCTYCTYGTYCTYCTHTGDARKRVDTWARVQFQLFSSEGGAQHRRDSNDQDDQERPGTT